jgi:hypothetical protein
VTTWQPLTRRGFVRALGLGALGALGATRRAAVADHDEGSKVEPRPPTLWIGHV